MAGLVDLGAELEEAWGYLEAVAVDVGFVYLEVEFAAVGYEGYAGAVGA